MFKIKNIILLFVVINLTAMVGFAQQAKTKTAKVEKRNITVEELVQLMKADSNLTLLDVRTPPELNGPLGHINGVINIPVQVLEKRLDELNKYKDKKFYVICRSGHRSGIATKILLKHGFNVVNVMGGMIAYNKLKKH